MDYFDEFVLCKARQGKLLKMEIMRKMEQVQVVVFSDKEFFLICLNAASSLLVGIL